MKKKRQIGELGQICATSSLRKVVHANPLKYRSNGVPCLIFLKYRSKEAMPNLLKHRSNFFVIQGATLIFSSVVPNPPRSAWPEVGHGGDVKNPLKPLRAYPPRRAGESLAERKASWALGRSAESPRSFLASTRI